MDLPKTAFKTLKLSIDELHFQYGDKKMRTEDIVSFSYASMSTSGIGKSVEYHFRVDDANENFIRVVFIDTILAGTGEGESRFDKVVQAFWSYFGNRILADMQDKIFAGEDYTLFQCTINRSGITFERKPLFSKARDYTIAWNDLKIEYFNGLIYLKSISEKKANTVLNMNTGNVPVFDAFASWVIEDSSRMTAVMTGDRSVLGG